MALFQGFAEDRIDERARVSMPPDEYESEPVEPASKRGPLRVVKPTERGDRHEIKLGPEVHRTTDAMAEALRKDPDLYQRAGALAHVIRTDETAIDSTPGTPVVRTVPVSMLTNRVSLYARCIRWNGKGFDHVSPPGPQVKAVHELGSWRGIRELRGIIEAPSMRPDGTLIQEAGYDGATGYLYEPNAAFPLVPDAPTHSDAVLAYAKLLEPFADFPYVNESHRSATIAALLTLLARPAIAGSVPCWLFDASAARSGKSLQVDILSIISSGRAASRMTYPETDEELEKAISAFALRGASSLNFDNVARKFGGAPLDKVITAVDQVDFRRLGSTEIVSVPWRAVVFGSGNNVSCRGDMLPRVLSPRIETALDNPERRTDLTHADLRGWCREHRAELATAALTILRAYVCAGRPEQPDVPRWGGFEQWSRLIPHAMVWVGAPDPMGARRGLDGDEDPDALAHVALVDGWDRLCTSSARLDGLTIKQAITLLYERDRDAEPDGHDSLREVLETLTNARPGFAPSTKAVGERLRRWRNKPVLGRKLSGEVAHAGTIRWRVLTVGK